MPWEKGRLAGEIESVAGRVIVLEERRSRFTVGVACFLRQSPDVQIDGVEWAICTEIDDQRQIATVETAHQYSPLSL